MWLVIHFFTVLFLFLGCGLSFHKRCVYKIPNNCSYARRRRSSTYLHTTHQSDQVGLSLSIPNMATVSADNYIFVIESFLIR